MATCANCKSDAVYEYRVTSDFKIDYCSFHLPKFLTGKRDAGLLKPTPVVEAPIVEDPAPVTKATKKKTSSVG